MGNDVPFFWFLDPAFLIFAGIAFVGYVVWKAISNR
jgi:hypothetical protein